MSKKLPKKVATELVEAIQSKKSGKLRDFFKKYPDIDLSKAVDSSLNTSFNIACQLERNAYLLFSMMLRHVDHKIIIFSSKKVLSSKRSHSSP